MLKWLLACLVLCAAAPTTVFAQATSRPCAVPADGDHPGPACLLAQSDLGQLPAGDLYWHVTGFDDPAAANAAKGGDGTVTQAFGRYWLFAIGPKHDPRPGETQVGPLPVTDREGRFVAEYLQSTFAPGMTAPVHVHSGPEAFYVVSGDTCLESPDGAQVAHGPGSSLIIRQGPPMLLMATGTGLRRGFALILHDQTHPPTTLVHDWTPKGLCHM